MCTLLKSTVFWKLVRQSCLRLSSWEELPPPPNSLFCSFSFVLYSPGLFPWHRNYIFHAQLSVFCLKYLSLSAGLIFIKKKHFQCNPLFVILQGGRSTTKTIHCFNILTLSRCTDHKQNWTVYFCNVVLVPVWYICGCFVCVCLWGCFCMCLTEKKVLFSLKLIYTLLEERKSEKQ